MYRKKLSRVMRLTAVKAAELLKFNTFLGQRAMIEFVVQTRMGQITDGTFREAEVVLGTAPDGAIYLMNGQHTCEACRRLGTTIDIWYAEYECETDTDMWKLFASFDTHLGRSQRQIMKAARGLFVHEELHGVRLEVLQLCGAALYALGAGLIPNFNTKGMGKVDRVAAVDTFAKEVIVIDGYVPQSAIRLKVSIVTAILVTFRVNAKRGREFWDRVLIGDDLKRDTPQHRLNKYLTGDSKPLKGGSMHAIIYKTCIGFWNSFMDGDDRQSVKARAMKELPQAHAKHHADK